MPDLPPALPGADLIEKGLADLAAGQNTVEALLVAIGAPRLRELGLSLPAHTVAGPEGRLYALLAEADVDSAHGRYNALLRRLVRFEHALASARG